MCLRIYGCRHECIFRQLVAQCWSRGEPGRSWQRDAGKWHRLSHKSPVTFDHHIVHSRLETLREEYIALITPPAIPVPIYPVTSVGRPIHQSMEGEGHSDSHTSAAPGCTLLALCKETGRRRLLDTTSQVIVPEAAKTIERLFLGPFSCDDHIQHLLCVARVECCLLSCVHVSMCLRVNMCRRVLVEQLPSAARFM